MENIKVTGEAAGGHDVLAILQKESNFDVLLLDLYMPDMDGFELIARITSRNMSLPILVFSFHNEPLVVKRVFQVGASGFITKGCTQETLMTAVRKVASGVRYVEPIIAELMIFKRDDITKEVPHDKLSERELQILKMFAEGKTGNEIATTLAISKKTVSTHKVRLMQKMNFQNIAELVLYAANYALVE
jgi:DNA-binding NarL/FixJ family response regulator